MGGEGRSARCSTRPAATSLVIPLFTRRTHKHQVRLTTVRVAALVVVLDARRPSVILAGGHGYTFCQLCSSKQTKPARASTAAAERAGGGGEIDAAVAYTRSERERERNSTSVKYRGNTTMRCCVHLPQKTASAFDHSLGGCFHRQAQQRKTQRAKLRLSAGGMCLAKAG